MQNLLITGGCGFIGTNFVRLMLEKHPDWKIVNLDKLTYAGNLESLADPNPIAVAQAVGGHQGGFRDAEAPRDARDAVTPPHAVDPVRGRILARHLHAREHVRGVVPALVPDGLAERALQASPEVQPPRAGQRRHRAHGFALPLPEMSGTVRAKARS